MSAIEETIRNLKHLCSTDARKLKNRLTEDLVDFYRPADKIRIVESLLNLTREESIKHSKICENPNSCSKSRNLTLTEFYLIQELEILGVNTGQEIFNNSEQTDISNKLDDILNEIALLKLGQELTYDDLKEEIEELKTLFFLSKKNWKQLLLGKIADMTIAGIISESVSKKLIEILKNEVLKYFPT